MGVRFVFVMLSCIESKTEGGVPAYLSSCPSDIQLICCMRRFVCRALSLPAFPPDMSWIEPVSPLPIPSIPPGGAATLQLMLRVPEGATVGQTFTAQGMLAAASGDVAGAVPLSVELAVATEPTGSLEVRCSSLSKDTCMRCTLCSAWDA